ncbi:hypothetical protein BJY00DRAFT_291029 [Aspergillus carlsbadensis]|nr:hypothetical protein BJY00DRAFT_291029 [Aspergillus carlsbadensis]
MHPTPDDERLHLSGDAPPPYSQSSSTTPPIPNATPPKSHPIEEYWHRYGIYGLTVRAVLRALQFIFAIIAASLYGVDLGHATSVNEHAQSEWIYAEFVAALSAITCVVHCSVTVTRVPWCVWDGVLVILWLAQIGVFATIFYPSARPGYEGATQSVSRMRAAVWMSLINMLLWLFTAVLGMSWCIRTRRCVRQTDGEPSRFRRALACFRKRDDENVCGTLEKGLLGADDVFLREKQHLGNKGRDRLEGALRGASGGL